MANYRKRYSKMTGKWTPVAAVSKTLSTRKIAERIEKESTVSIADIMAVLYSLPHVLRDEMANGNAVKLDGIGMRMQYCRYYAKGGVRFTPAGGQTREAHV